MKPLAPIALFVYNRPEHTEKVLEALSKNTLAMESELYIFCDGPKKNANESDLKKIDAVYEIASQKKWCKSVTISRSIENKGLADSILAGVTKIVNKFGQIIVLEDDLIPFPFFLKYMNDALTVYESNPEVACISAYVYPVKGSLPETFFIKGADCWGWATWKRGWDIFEGDGKKLLAELEQKSLAKMFDFDFTYPYMQMLKDQIEMRNNSWAIRWYAATFLQNKFCLYPGKSLIQNIGIDGSGTHSGTSTKWEVSVYNESIPINKIKVEQSKKGYKLFKNYFTSLKAPLKVRVKTFIKKLIGR